MRGEAIRALFRTAWKVTLVVLVTVLVMWAIGWVIQATTGGDGATATVEER